MTLVNGQFGMQTESLRYLLHGNPLLYKKNLRDFWETLPQLCEIKKLAFFHLWFPFAHTPSASELPRLALWKAKPWQIYIYDAQWV